MASKKVVLQKALQQAEAAQYERTDAPSAHRNGYKNRSLKTRYGETILRKPTAVLGAPVRDAGLRALCLGGENAGECDH